MPIKHLDEHSSWDIITRRECCADRAVEQDSLILTLPFPPRKVHFGPIQWSSEENNLESRPMEAEFS